VLNLDPLVLGGRDVWGGMSARGSVGAPGTPPAGSGAEPQENWLGGLGESLRHFLIVCMLNLIILKLFYTAVFMNFKPVNA